MSARLLSTLAVEKVWGRDRLPEPFPVPQGRPIGEIWFEPPDDFDPLLAKYLFTSEKLSVQVHPPGKDECWLILDCEPGARLAVGFRREFDSEELRQGALDGSIEQMLTWHAVEPGDFFYLPAGTVHAIGAGCSLVEMQQNCGITYRFYDYGRPRELHLDQALAHAQRGPYDVALKQRAWDTTKCLVDGPFFRLDRIVGPISDQMRNRHATACLVLPLAGTVAVGSLSVPVGGCAKTDSLADLHGSDDAIYLICSAKT